jgi:hypothetical protein
VIVIASQFMKHGGISEEGAITPNTLDMGIMEEEVYLSVKDGTISRCSFKIWALDLKV